MPDELLTVAEIAERLKLNQQTIRNWIDRGDLPAIRVGARRVRVSAAELDAYIAASSSAKTPDEDKARTTFSDALEAMQAAEGTDDLGPALRRLSRACTTLARAVSK